MTLRAKSHIPSPVPNAIFTVVFYLLLIENPVQTIPERLGPTCKRFVCGLLFDFSSYFKKKKTLVKTHYKSARDNRHL